MFFLLLLSICYSQDIIDPFSQSEIVNNYYSFQGSGDIDRDGDRDLDDITALDDGIKNMQADVDLDGIQGTTSDRDLLLENINNGTVLPYDWNALQSREERDSTLYKVTAIDGISKNEIPYNITNPPLFVSGDYAKYTYVKHMGWIKQNGGDKDLPPIFDPKENNITGIPIFYASFRNSDTGVNHGQNFIWTGDDSSNPNNLIIGEDSALDPYDWTGIEPLNSPPNVLLKFNQNFNPPENTEITLKTIDTWADYDGISYNFFGREVIKFKINSEGIPELVFQNPNLLLTRPTVGIEDEYTSVPPNYSLDQNFPNPFNPSTTISFTLPEESAVSISIYDLVGRKVNELTTSSQLAGSHSIQWNGTDQQGNLVPAGIYFYQLKAGDFIQTKKMVLMK